MTGTDRSFLIDTNSAIAALDNDPVVGRLIREAMQVYVPSIVLGELYFGAEKSEQKEANLKRVNRFAGDHVVLVCDTETARSYGSVAYQLRKKGRPIPVNDTWIAALALQYGLTLLTRDAHFKYVDNLSIETW
ncbi:MAG: type II toxin-antitoxin system VapC family toxin [Anaerolineae bacterium]|nr:type II toxin-antitoxin system VapC family toxin [Anaerolineae bacterium]